LNFTNRNDGSEPIPVVRRRLVRLGIRMQYYTLCVIEGGDAQSGCGQWQQCMGQSAGLSTNWSILHNRCSLW